MNTNESMHSEMVQVWQNSIHRTEKTAHLGVLMTVQSFNSTQNSSDNLPSYLQTNTIAQMLSIGGQGEIVISVKTVQTRNHNLSIHILLYSSIFIVTALTAGHSSQIVKHIQKA